MRDARTSVEPVHIGGPDNYVNTVIVAGLFAPTLVRCLLNREPVSRRDDAESRCLAELLCRMRR